jgi:hypothetical protein
MKYYALLHGVYGLAEGYSDTTVRWFKTLGEAVEAKQKSLAGLMMAAHEEIQSTTDGMQDIIVFSDDEGESEILKIVELKPTFPENVSIREFFVWNQMNCEAPYDGDYLPTDMAVIKDLCERLEAVAVAVCVDALHEFVNDLWHGGTAMFDADDLCVYYFQVPKPNRFTS